MIGQLRGGQCLF